MKNYYEWYKYQNEFRDKIIIEETDTKYERYILDVNKIKPYIKTILEAYKKEYNFDLSYMKFIFDTQPHTDNGKPTTKLTSEQSAGSWTKLGIVYLNPEMYKALLFYSTNKKITDKIFHGFIFHILSHELAHEIWNNLASDHFKNFIIKEAIDTNFNTNYLNSLPEYKKEPEMFCDYLAYKLKNKYLSKINSIYS